MSGNEVMNDNISAELCKHATKVSFVFLLATDAIAKFDQLIDFTRFSNYLLLLKTTEFIKACQKRYNHRYPSTELSATEISKGEKY